MLMNNDNAINETARYLGLRDAGNERATIEECLNRAEGLVPQVFSATVNISAADFLFDSELARQHFHNCSHICFVAVTLGHKSTVFLDGAFALSARYGVITDAALTYKVENALDSFAEDLKKKYKTTTRISCGYGDLSIDNHSEILKILGIKRQEIKENDCKMLIPNKSVIAIIGIYETN